MAAASHGDVQSDALINGSEINCEVKDLHDCRKHG